MVSLGNGTSVYLKAPAKDVATWTKASASSAAPILHAAYTHRSQDDPNALFDAFASGTYQVTGGMPMDGVPTTLYTQKAKGPGGQTTDHLMTHLEPHGFPREIRTVTFQPSGTMSLASTHFDRFGQNVPISAP